MDVTGIGVQTIAPTTGTAAQTNNPPADRPADRDSEQRVASPPPPGTGAVVDKSV